MFKKNKQTSKKALAKARRKAEQEKVVAYREECLREELKELTEELSQLKYYTAQLRAEKIWLSDELERSNDETNEYMKYIEERNAQRNADISALKAFNEHQAANIAQETKHALDEFEKKKHEHQLEKYKLESVMAKLEKQLHELEPYKALRRTQEQKIASLKKEMIKCEAEHAKTINKLKIEFLHEKQKYEKEAEEMVRSLAKEANKEASRCLMEHIQAAASDNKRLTKTLRNLFEKTNELNQKKIQLKEQNKVLARELAFSKEVKRPIKDEPDDYSGESKALTKFCDEECCPCDSCTCMDK